MGVLDGIRVLDFGRYVAGPWCAALLGANRQPTGDRSQAAAPSDVFRTRDGWIIVQVVGNALFARLAMVLGEPQWQDDERFVTDVSRGAHGGLISNAVAEWCAAKSTAEALEIFGKASIPAGPVLDFEQALRHPHVQAAGFFQDVAYPGLPRPAPVVRTPVALSRTPGSIRQAAPALGADIEAILEELGFSAVEIETMHREEAV